MVGSSTVAPTRQRFNQVRRVLWIILLLNLVVALAKFIYGVITKSAAMQADGIHSVFDSAGNVVGIVGLALAARPADMDHPYGHAKFETYASALIGIMLILAGYNIGSTAIETLVHGGEHPTVNAGSFIVMVGTLAINLCVTVYERKKGRELNSEILSADAMHTLSDALVSISVIISLILVKLGFPIADPIMSLVVALAILYTAIGVFKQANSTLSDQARIPTSQIYDVASKVEGVRDVHAIRTRGTEGEVYVDLHILVHPSKTIYLAHRIGNQVEAAIEQKFPQVVDVMVHIEPDIETEREAAEEETVSPAE